jgi:3-dehydroquinate dehydratase
MENTELSNIAVDENGNQAPLDLNFEYQKTKTELDDLTIEFLKLRGQYEKLVLTNKKQSELLVKAEANERKMKSLEGHVVTLQGQNTHYKRIIEAIKGTVDKGMGI